MPGNDIYIGYRAINIIGNFIKTDLYTNTLRKLPTEPWLLVKELILSFKL